MLAPKRPRTPEGEPSPGPLYVRVADFLLPFVLVAVVLKIGVSEVFGWAERSRRFRSAGSRPPIGLWCAIDSWIFAPRRQIAAGRRHAGSAAAARRLLRCCRVLVVAVIVRMISAETLDFSLVLLVLSVATGLVWLIDHLVFRKQREQPRLPQRRRRRMRCPSPAPSTTRAASSRSRPSCSSCAPSSSSRSAFLPTR